MGVVTGSSAPFNGGTITNELNVTPDHDSGTGTVEIIAKGDDFPTRLLGLGTRDNGGSARLVWAFDEAGLATLGPSSVVDVGGSWILQPFTAGTTALQARQATGDSADTDIFEARREDGSLVYWIDGTGTAEYRLSVGASVRVLDHNFAEIFRVDEDGSVHIKTGTTIVADL